MKKSIAPVKALELPFKEFVPGISIRAVHLDNLTVTYVELEQDVVLPAHSHPQEQVSYIAKGVLRMTVGENTYDLGAGEFLAIPGGVEHSAVVLSGPVLAIDSFSPKREDYVF